MNIYDISQLAGVSIATVSRVINGSDRVSARTRQKVLRVIEENGYTPNAFARGLGLNTMHTVGLLCADSSDPYLAQAVYNLEQELRLNGYDCLLCCTGYARETKEKYLDLLLSKRVDGLIFAGSQFTESAPEDNEYIRRAARQVPSVLLGGSLEGPNLYVTQCDERAAMRSAAARLMDSGCESILYLYNSLSFSSRNKLAGYREGCQLCGKPAPASHALLLTWCRRVICCCAAGKKGCALTQCWPPTTGWPWARQSSPSGRGCVCRRICRSSAATTAPLRDIATRN